jgi:polar amino acid transport system permease protein
MNYVFEFGQVFAAWDELLAGALRTLWLSAASMVIGLIVAIAGALGKTSGPRWLRNGSSTPISRSSAIRPS